MTPQRQQPTIGGLVPRDEASVHVLDSVVQGGDAVWEGLRITDRPFNWSHTSIDSSIPRTRWPSVSVP